MDTMIPLFESPPMDPFGRVLFQSTQREVMLRNPMYPHMLLDTLRGLFSDSDVDSDCRAVLGFSGIEPYQKLGPPPASLQVTRTVARVSDKAH
ncbi:MAG: hypothetical protein WKF73_18120 [Nocardioidaceae bacterium]